MTGLFGDALHEAKRKELHYIQIMISESHGCTETKSAKVS